MKDNAKIEALNEVVRAIALDIDATITGVSELAGAGSSRRYFRYSFYYEPDVCPMFDSAIGTIGTSAKENRSFIELSGLFDDEHLPVPLFFGCSDDSEVYVQSDVGDVSLYGMLQDKDPEAYPIIEKLMVLLPGFQTIPHEKWEDMVFNPPFTGREVLGDLHYFKDCFLRTLGISYDEQALEKEFDDIAASIDRIGEEYVGLMLRDFQSRNIMVYEGTPYVIDFQGARLGPVVYDAVSFLWQAKAGIEPYRRRESLKRYAQAFASVRKDASTEQMLRMVPLVVLIRTFQVLGAYGLRGLIERKTHFLSSIPNGVRNLVQILKDPVGEGSVYGWTEDPEKRWPEISRIAERLAALPLVNLINCFVKKEGKLTVSVYSFSYKQGYPFDLSGNGGGFMFDCRGLHNPGRYEEYKTKTGMDREVIEFLDGYEEVKEFLKDCRNLVFRSVNRYLQRGFNSLQVGFGCTGGQHRSVYCAEHLAEMLRKEFPEIGIVLSHREQSVIKEL